MSAHPLWLFSICYRLFVLFIPVFAFALSCIYFGDSAIGLIWVRLCLCFFGFGWNIILLGTTLCWWYDCWMKADCIRCGPASNACGVMMLTRSRRANSVRRNCRFDCFLPFCGRVNAAIRKRRMIWLELLEGDVVRKAGMRIRDGSKCRMVWLLRFIAWSHLEPQRRFPAR